ncbi:MAG TPA: trehalose-phosphatase [Desulfobacteraceae bacterium]|mgnify:CR=1 FL=1|nr:trehalose-phosphatase [Desulfobacteraceae bacterium]
MKLLNPNFDIDRFFKCLHQSTKNALLLDYDGTLAPFHENPAKAFPYEGITDMLDKLMDVPGLRVVIVSGRWIKSLQPLLQLRKRPEIWGSHGLERLMPDGSYQVVPVEEETLEGLVAADEWIDSAGFRGRVERKPGSVAFHWRGVDETLRRQIDETVRAKWALMAEAWNLQLKEFDGGLELRVPGRDKGDAVNTVCREMDFRAQVAYFGDDFTDEDAFRALKGRGLGVLVRETLRPTEADMWLKPPVELLGFLKRWIRPESN